MTLLLFQLSDEPDASVVKKFSTKGNRSISFNQTFDNSGGCTPVRTNQDRLEAHSIEFHQTLSSNRIAASCHLASCHPASCRPASCHSACCRPASWHRGFSSNAGDSTDAPSKIEQYWKILRLRAAAHIETIPKKAYLRSLENVLKTLPEVEGSVDEIMKAIGVKFQETVKKRRDLAKDARGASHLQLACLVLASYRALLPYFAHKRHVTADVIREPVGAAAAGTVDLISRFALALSFDKFAHVSRGLDYLGRDFGRSFDTTQQKEPGYHSLKVTRCLYNTFFELEREPELTQLFCAFDRMWFDHVSPRKHGIEFSRPTTLADGAPLCNFVLRRKTTT